MCTSSSPSSKKEAEYRAEEDLRTLTRAEEVRGDSTRMAACARMHWKQARTMTRTGRLFASRAGGKRAGGRSART